ncbi:uncharacterized protein LOC111266274 [Varroa jacobsoni]|uniref:uncharacterized protein LOC111266274 n=1 Tax=Varroa jacobsoni TaxID=62625 RepID=UPI000BF4EF78|nr:uncharacterized protein LOC111266274 [Varroa jacobsoni]XP_022699371.1 uncharacterized protein LOC111266274 [Varroa jacobsoni]XP_022699372.1 uncharacterized protein LOC111266274 [Varroa jacobsoni]
MEITTVPSSAVHTEPVDELQKELTESPKNDVKGDSSKILDSNLRCAMLLDRMEASPLKDLDDEVLASPYTSIRRAQKDYGISSPRSNRKVASPGRFPGTTHWSASNVDSPYVGYRFAPKLPALAMLPQKTNNYKRYWLLIPVVGVVMAMTVAGAISLWHLGKFKCSTSELQRCRNFGATSCINRDDGTECLCTNKLKIGPCEPPSCRDVAQEKCFNRICVEPVRCVFAREYIEALSREDRAVDVSCTEVLSEICASSGVIPFCANSNTYPFGHICNPDPIRPLRCDTSESEYLAQAITRHDRSTGKTNLTEYCYRKRRIYSCLVGLIDYDVPHNASVINCGNWCSKWEGDGCSCTLQAKQAKVKTRSTYNKKSRKGITVSQHCAPKSFPR